MTRALVLIEHDNTDLNQTSLAAVTAAACVADQIDGLVLGAQCYAVAEALATYQGVSRVLLIDDPAYKHCFAENQSKVLQQLAPEYDYLIAAATTRGKDIMPRAAALLDSEMVSDIIAIEGPQEYLRPIYAGNALSRVKNTAEIQILTVRSTAFALPLTRDTSAAIEPLSLVISAEKTQFVELKATASERPDLMAASVVVAGGRGLGSKENFQLIEQLADQLGAAIGASRAAVDAGFVPNDYQVGQTGKVVAPALYIAVGISGAIQHVAGMKESKVIVAINKDETAPIFDIADYGLVGDLFTLVPELIQALQQG